MKKTSQKPCAPTGLADTTGSAEVKAALERIRTEKKPTRRGVIVCGTVMAQMLQIGWHSDQLDALEILFWHCRDANGEVIRTSSPNTKGQP